MDEPDGRPRSGVLGAFTGLVLGFIVSKIVNLRGDDPRGGIFVAGLSGLLGGVIGNVAFGAGVGGWSRVSLFCAALAAGVGVTIWHLVRSRYVSHARQTTRSSY